MNVGITVIGTRTSSHVFADAENYLKHKDSFELIEVHDYTVCPAKGSFLECNSGSVYEVKDVLYLQKHIIPHRTRVLVICEEFWTPKGRKERTTQI